MWFRSKRVEGGECPGWVRIESCLRNHASKRLEYLPSDSKIPKDNKVHIKIDPLFIIYYRYNPILLSVGITFNCFFGDRWDS